MIQPLTPFADLIPSDPFDLYWTMWTTPASTFRGRRLLVLDSLFIHHPNATIIMLSPTLDDTLLFLPYRQRGYHIYAFNVSLDCFLQWKWYLTNETKHFLLQWNSSGTFFYTHLTDYYRTVALYLYGGTYMDMDALILQPFPRQEFIGLDRTGLGDDCPLCISNTSGLYLAPGVFRFRPHRSVLRRIHQQTFTTKVYDPSCFNCVGPKAYTFHITQSRQNNDFELVNLQLLEPHRLYPFMWNQPSLIFSRVQPDTSLELADLKKRSYSLHLFGHVSAALSIARGSLIDLLFNQLHLGNARSNASSVSLSSDQSNINVQLIHPLLYVYSSRKQGRFVGRDVIFLRVRHTSTHSHLRWNITIHVHNGTIALPSRLSLSDLNQAQMNHILHLISYTPLRTRSIDTLVIIARSEHVSVRCSVSILVFSEWVTVVTNTLGTPDRWSVLQRLSASVERYFPGTTIRIASDSGKKIDIDALLNFTTPDSIRGCDLKKNVIVHDLPEDCGLSSARNYLVKMTKTPFFFLLDDDFELEEDSHLDILLELIYTHDHIGIIAGKIPEDIRQFQDYSGVFLRYNETLQLVYAVPDDKKGYIWFPRSSDKKKDNLNGCRRVDFVPNVFLGRRTAVSYVRWDNQLKLGEHEDFFIRFAQADQSVYSCPYINVHHNQKQWWIERNNSYYDKRARVYEYLKEMLRKHNLKREITFNYLLASLDGESPE